MYHSFRDIFIDLFNTAAVCIKGRQVAGALRPVALRGACGRRDLIVARKGVVVSYCNGRDAAVADTRTGFGAAHGESCVGLENERRDHVLDIMGAIVTRLGDANGILRPFNILDCGSCGRMVGELEFGGYSTE